ncbi:Aste57867_18680 [Aphanomyces stellatus]|uniref:Aste57867_18680 protein n=1 Tax=Aphanomyces stellatus TaxID=120398 RepID=A0A485LAR1_9STRA|nr:hypothetical protein As57867_018618 [Aphanomyces stellatus]VFT95415.1 Aste57867_18680 [Aphanomyces stellatus]
MMSQDELHHALRMLRSNPQEGRGQTQESALPSEYSVNLLQPFGGASAGAAAEAHDKEKAKASSLDKAHTGASAEKKADRGDIFYEKLIIFKTSHDRVKENADTDSNRLSQQDALRESDRGQAAAQHQSAS